MGLFWYPAINNYSWFDGKYNKNEMLDSYVRYFLARLQCMFKYEGLPDTIPAKWFEHYLLCNGNCIIARVNDDLYALTGGMGNDATPYYIPAGYIVANPWLKTEDGTLSKQYWTETIDINGERHEQDAVLVFNDTYSQGVLPLLNRYCSQLVENDISLNIADILARATINISASDDKTKASAELYLKRLRDGQLGVMSEQAFIEGLNIREFHYVAQSITPLIEYHQYIKASLFNELGLNSNYNMKRESINSNESQLNDDMLHPLIDNMLRERREGIQRVNEFFGTDITVSFDSAWLENEKEEQAVLTDIETPEDDAKIYPGVDIPENTTEDEDGLGLEDMIEDETPAEEIEEAEVIEDNNASIAEVIEELTDAVHEVADALTEDESEEVNDVESEDIE